MGQPITGDSVDPKTSWVDSLDIMLKENSN
jgi:hypothetical protein